MADSQRQERIYPEVQGKRVRGSNAWSQRLWSVIPLCLLLVGCTAGLTTREELTPHLFPSPLATVTPTSLAPATPRVTATAEGAALEKLITGYVQHLDPDRLAEVPERLTELGVGANEFIRVVAVEPRSEEEVPILLFIYYGEGPMAQGHLIFWWQEGRWNKQALEELTVDDTFIEARQQAVGGGVELGLVYDTNSGGSAQRPVYTLWRLEDETWQRIWKPGERWRGMDGEVSLPGLGLDTVVVTSSSWQMQDERSQIFHESNPGPHRWFEDTWAREGDAYRLAESRTLPSTYNTLVEFVYLLRHNDEAGAGDLVSDPALVTKSRELGFARIPDDTLIYLESPEQERQGPLSFGLEESDVTVHFIQRGEEWVIVSLETSLRATQTPSPTPVPTPVVLAPSGLGVQGQIALVHGGAIWVFDIKSGALTRLTAPAYEEPREGGSHSHPRWSSDGQWLMHVATVKHTRGSDQQAVRHWLHLTENTEAWPTITGGTESLAADPLWAPVGHRLAFISSDPDVVLPTGAHRSRGDLWVLDIGENYQTEAKQILPPGSGVGRFAWSPDGVWLAFEKWEVTSEDGLPTYQGLWRVRADGTGLSEVYGNADRLNAQSRLAGWSPDGQYLLFWQGPVSASIEADGLPLMSIALTSGEPQRLGETLLYSDYLAWSRQGDQLALVKGSGRSTWANKQIWTVAAKGDNPIDLSADEARVDLSPVWSPDGQHIAYVSGLALSPEEAMESEKLREAIDARRIWVMNTDGTEKRQLTHDPEYSDEYPQWSSDGRYILFIRRRGEQADLWLMDSDGGNQRPLLGDLTQPGVPGFSYYGHFEWTELLDWTW